MISASGCADAKGPPAPSDAGPDAGEVSVVLGVPSGEDNLDFEPLEPGGELRLQTFGQGGTHVYLAIRCVGFGNRAFVGVTLKNLLTGAEAASPAPVRPQLLYCRDEQICDLVPFLAMTSGLTEPGEERDGLRIEVRADVSNRDGIAASAVQEAVLSTADL
jgi:hypothetical protein